MRPDLAKCVIEVPRRGSRWKNVKIRWFGKFVRTEDGPDYEGLTRIPASQKAAKIALHDCKYPGDKLGPLRNYLRSSCGRLWDDVYSEIAYHIGRFSHQEGLRHIIDAHVDVSTSCYRGIDGKVYACNKRGVHKVESSWRGQFYVEPETGILREAPRYQPKRYPKAPVTQIPISEGKEYKKVDGIWYYREFEMTSLKEKFVTHGRSYERDNEILVWEKKRQLGKKQLKQLRLTNGGV